MPDRFLLSFIFMLTVGTGFAFGQSARAQPFDNSRAQLDLRSKDLQSQDWDLALSLNRTQQLVRWIHQFIRPRISATETALSGACGRQELDVIGADPIDFKARHVHGSIYSPDRAHPRTLLIFPPTGGENAFDDGYATFLCKHGFKVALMQHWEHDTERDLDLGTYDRASLRTLAAAEHVLQYLSPIGDVGVLGTSLGAIEASGFMGYEPRVKAAVLIVGGAPMSDVIAHTDEIGMSAVRARQMEAMQLTSVDQFAKALRKNMKIDNLYLAQNSKKIKVRLYIATHDTTVPTQNQLDLAKSYQHPEVIEYSSNHVGAIWNTYAVEGPNIAVFFERNLH